MIGLYLFIILYDLLIYFILIYFLEAWIQRFTWQWLLDNEVMFRFYLFITHKITKFYWALNLRILSPYNYYWSDENSIPHNIF